MTTWADEYLTMLEDCEKRDATSFMWASFGSRRMLERRRELPELNEERAKLQRAIQPELQLVSGDTEKSDLRKVDHVVANETKGGKRPAA